MATRTGHAIATTIWIGLMSCSLAAAQDAAQDVTSVQAKNSAYRMVHKSCAADTARFCPELAQETAIPREQVMCLKTYRVDLTLNCRKALAAVKTATDTEP